MQLFYLSNNWAVFQSNWPSNSPLILQTWIRNLTKIDLYFLYKNGYVVDIFFLFQLDSLYNLLLLCIERQQLSSFIYFGIWLARVSQRIHRCSWIIVIKTFNINQTLNFNWLFKCLWYKKGNLFIFIKLALLTISKFIFFVHVLVNP